MTVDLASRSTCLVALLYFLVLSLSLSSFGTNVCVHFLAVFFWASADWFNGVWFGVFFVKGVEPLVAMCKCAPRTCCDTRPNNADDPGHPLLGCFDNRNFLSLVMHTLNTHFPRPFDDALC